MLNHEQAQELVFCQLALDLRHHSPGELIEGEIEREWGWLFLYPNFSGGLPCGWLVNRHSGLMKHLPAVTSTHEAVAEYEETLRRQTPDSGGTPG
jgi:hypothetical protein